MARAVMCNSVQQKSEHAATIGHEPPSGETTDPGFPGSAAVCLDFIQLEGLAVAIPWGVESPFRTSFRFNDLRRNSMAQPRRPRGRFVVIVRIVCETVATRSHPRIRRMRQNLLCRPQVRCQLLDYLQTS